MENIKLNGITLKPQPIIREWTIPVTGNKLNGTNEIGAYSSLILQAPKMNGQYFNWQDFENQVLNSVTVFAPGEAPECVDYTTYSAGVVSRAIQSYQSPEDNTVTNISIEILVIV